MVELILARRPRLEEMRSGELAFSFNGQQAACRARPAADPGRTPALGPDLPIQLARQAAPPAGFQLPAKPETGFALPATAAQTAG
jgi:hypothetical protein